MMTEDDLFVALSKIVNRKFTAWQIMVLIVIKRFPGSSYTDIALKLDGRADGYRRFGNFVRALVERGLVEDRRIKSHSRTSGRLYIAPRTEEMLNELVEGL